MSTNTVGEILLRMLTDKKFARAVLRAPAAALAPYKRSLSKVEFHALSTSIAPKAVAAFDKTPYVGAWKLLAKNVAKLDKGLKRDLNDALAERSKTHVDIPCTGA